MHIKLVHTEGPEEIRKIDTDEDFGLTAIGYHFTELDGPEMFIHPAQYLRVEIHEGE